MQFICDAETDRSRRFFKFKRLLWISGLNAWLADWQYGFIGLSLIKSGGYRSGQTGQTVNLLALPSQVRILHPPFLDFGFWILDFGFWILDCGLDAVRTFGR